MTNTTHEARLSHVDELKELSQDGHLHDAALVALADGQAELGGACMEHLASCTHCSGRLEQAAELSFALDLCLAPSDPRAAPGAQPEFGAPALRLPRKALVAALGLAALGALPGLLRGAPALDLRRVLQAAAVSARALNQALHSPRLNSSLLASALPFLLAALLLAFGTVIALRYSDTTRKHHV